MNQGVDHPNGARTRRGLSVSPIAMHRLTVALLYALAFVAAVLVYRYPEARSSIVAILATGSIFGTLGSAIMAVCALWEKDLAERIALNLDILHRDILKDPSPWRRWPFLKRRATWRLFGGETIRADLSNPPIEFDVGSHRERFDLPSIPDDYYDLPAFSNYLRLWKFRRPFMTRAANTPKDGDGAMSEVMKYECVHDIWRSIVVFRLARYGMQLGSGLVLFGVVMVLWHIAIFEPPPLRFEDFKLF